MTWRGVRDHSDFATVPLAIVALCVLRPGSRDDVLLSLVGIWLGIVAWTFVEYWVHRALHMRRFPRLRALHMAHHQHPEAAAGGTIWSSLIISALVASALALPMIEPEVLGFLAGYLGFILLHYGEHHGWSFAGVDGLAAHHVRHHHERPRGCFGVTTAWWDRLFKTL